MIVAGRLVHLFSKILMDRRQRRSVNFFKRYVIDDEAVEKSNAADAKAKAQASSFNWSKAVSGEVTDKLRVENSALKKLYEGLNYERKMDRRLQYEVTGFKFDGDDFDTDSDNEDSCKSASSGSDGEGNNSLLIGSPSSANLLSPGRAGTPSS